MSSETLNSHLLAQLERQYNQMLSEFIHCALVNDESDFGGAE